MQTFLPYPSFANSAKVLDNKRLGKQRVEAKQILHINLATLSPEKYFIVDGCEHILHENELLDTIIDGCPRCGSYISDVPSIKEWKEMGLKIHWENHPAVRMWRGYEIALAEYGLAICDEWIARGFKDNQLEFFEDNCLENDEDYSTKYPKWLGNTKFHNSHKSKLMFKGRVDVLVEKIYAKYKVNANQWLKSQGFILGKNYLTHSDLSYLENEFKYNVEENHYYKFFGDFEDNLPYEWNKEYWK